MNNKISQAILELVKLGNSLEVSIDLVLGKGTYQAIASDVYNSLRA